LLTTYRLLLDCLTPRERRRFWLLLLMMFGMGLIEMVGVLSILPLLTVISNPDTIQTNQYLQTAYQLLQFDNHQNFLIFLSLFSLTFFLISQLFKTITIYTIICFAKLRGFSIGHRLLSTYLRQPYAWFLNRHSAELGKSILSEVDRLVERSILPALRQIAFTFIVLCLIALLLATNPIIAISMGLIVGSAYALIIYLSRHYLLRIGRENIKANEQRFRVIQEGIGGVKEIKLLGIEQSYISYFQKPGRLFAKYETIGQTINEIPRFALESVLFGTMLAVVIFMLIFAEGQLDALIPVLGIYAFAGARMLPALQHIYRSTASMRFSRPILEKIHTDLVGAAKDGDGGGAGGMLELQDRLELVGVTYTYPEAERPTLANLNMTIEAKTTVGIVGSTGAGKTTTVDILLGLLYPDEGAVVVDGVPVDAGNRRGWQRSLGYVPQQIFLTDDTLAANIAFGVSAEELDMTAVERAARMAELHDFVVTELPKGYQTEVGERGVRLSGGQRQRVGIARALYRDPSVLILDEATSALDNRTERAVMDAVHNLAHAKTIVMIAHRLSTVKSCDKIFMLEKGRCVAAGPYESLLEDNRAFRELAMGAS